jgi:(p)ppGpp synthase/HD superfamily hydrolase
MLERAIHIAVDIHEGQKDLQGHPYILHPLRVMLKMDSLLTQIIAVLHDVFEDGGQEAISAVAQANFPLDAPRILNLLTREEGQSYDAYIDRIMTDQTAMKVKLADLEDNSSPQRVAGLLAQGVDPDKVHMRLRKYEVAMAKIKKELE